MPRVETRGPKIDRKVNNEIELCRNEIARCPLPVKQFTDPQILCMMKLERQIP